MSFIGSAKRGSSGTQTHSARPPVVALHPMEVNEHAAAKVDLDVGARELVGVAPWGSTGGR